MLPSIEYRPWTRDNRYSVGSDGTVIGPSGRPVGTAHAQGYTVITYRTPNGRTSTTAHAMVCETFHGPRPVGMEAAHCNGNPSDNRADNLRWVPAIGNAADRIAHGTNGRALNRHDVRAIRVASSTGATRAELATRYGVTPGTISHVCTGRTWRAA